MTTAPTPGRPIAPPPVAPPPTNGAPAAPAADPATLFSQGTEKRGYFVSIAGPEKYGKTTFAAGAPNPCFIMADRGGLKSMPRTIRRVVPDSWTAIMAALVALRDKPHDFGTVVLDTTFKAESMLIRHLVEKDKKANLRQVGGGYGAGNEMLESEINKVIDVFFTLNERGIHTIAISQIETKTEKDATVDDYERTALALSKRTAKVWAAAADVNMYIQPEIKEIDRIEGPGNAEDRVKVEFTGKALCHVRPTTGIQAGNRLFLDSPMVYSWAALEIGAETGRDLRDKLFAKLATLSGQERAAMDWQLNQAGWSREAALAVINAPVK